MAFEVIHHSEEWVISKMLASWDRQHFSARLLALSAELRALHHRLRALETIPGNLKRVIPINIITRCRHY